MWTDGLGYNTTSPVGRSKQVAYICTNNTLGNLVMSFLIKDKEVVEMQHRSLLDFSFSVSPLFGLHLLHHTPPPAELTQVFQWWKAGLPGSFGTCMLYHFHFCQANRQTMT